MARIISRERAERPLMRAGRAFGFGVEVIESKCSSRSAVRSSAWLGRAHVAVRKHNERFSLVLGSRTVIQTNLNGPVIVRRRLRRDSAESQIPSHADRICVVRRKKHFSNMAVRGDNSNNVAIQIRRRVRRAHVHRVDHRFGAPVREFRRVFGPSGGRPSVFILRECGESVELAIRSRDRKTRCTRK
jgi:hypothetical protein